MLVTSDDYGLIAERPMYFSYGPGWTGGHDTVGATSTSSAWYFAEGYTGPGFDEWICVLNPGGSPAHLTFHFQTQSAGEIVPAVQTVPPYSRASFSANGLLGGTYETSLLLASDLPVVAERSHVLRLPGRHPGRPSTGPGATASWERWGWPTIITSPRATPGPGFDEYLTIQNPLGAPITVDAEYQLGQGQGGPVNRTYTVPAESRRTVYVNGPEGVGEGVDTSVHLSSSDVFLAERPMYFNYRPRAGREAIASSDRGSWPMTGSSPRATPGWASTNTCASRTPIPPTRTVTITYYPAGRDPEGAGAAAHSRQLTLHRVSERPEARQGQTCLSPPR